MACHNRSNGVANEKVDQRLIVFAFLVVAMGMKLVYFFSHNCFAVMMYLITLFL